MPESEPQPSHDVAAMRRAYSARGLDVRDLAGDPLTQFGRWFSDVVTADLAEPNAMVLATASADGPSARIVLLKGYDANGFVFYTNLGSAKARDLAADSRAALLFPWHALARQVRVSGPVEAVDRDAVTRYFGSRPRESQFGAWASPQSEMVADREALDARYQAVEARFATADVVPAPDFWGGYRVRPETVEFWQGRERRMHDRLRYRRAGEDWVVERLAP